MTNPTNEHREDESITVLDVTYVNTQEGQPATFIGLWYTTQEKPKLLLFGPDRTDILSIEQGEKGTLSHDGNRWDFTPRDH